MNRLNHPLITVLKKLLFGYYIFISVVAYSFVELLAVLYNYELRTFSILSGLLVFSSYNFIAFLSGSQKKFTNLLVSILSCAFAIVLFKTIISENLGWFLILGILSLVYETPMEWRRYFKGIRYIPFFKLITISLSWWLMIFYLPMQSVPFDQSMDAWFWFLWIFLWCLAFDIRDRRVDQGKIRTLANSFEDSVIKIVIIILMSLLFILNPFSLYEYNGIALSILFLVFFSWTAFYLRSKYWSLILYDGLPFYWLIFISFKTHI